jgi:threonyl-tRNA synthetase
MLIVGPKEEEQGNVSLRSRTGGDQGAVTLADLKKRLAEEVKAKSLENVGG